MSSQWSERCASQTFFRHCRKNLNDGAIAWSSALSTADMQALFARLKDEATTLYPQVREQVELQAKGLNLQQVLASVGRP